MSDNWQSIPATVMPVAETYRTLTQNTVLRHAFGNAELSETEWREIEDLAAIADVTEPHKIDLNTIYSGIYAMLALARSLKMEIKPVLSRELTQPRSQMSKQNRVALEMTSSNLESNARMLVDRLSDLYVEISRIDDQTNGEQRAVRKRYPELADPSTWTIEP